jgi:hypothetical protein
LQAVGAAVAVGADVAVVAAGAVGAVFAVGIVVWFRLATKVCDDSLEIFATCVNNLFRGDSFFHGYAVLPRLTVVKRMLQFTYCDKVLGFG